MKAGLLVWGLHWLVSLLLAGNDGTGERHGNYYMELSRNQGSLFGDT